MIRPKKTLHNKTIGTLGEDKATQYLESQDYNILTRNFRTRYGEIDIVAQKDSAIYCVEVKTRLSNRFGSAIDAITPQKLNKMHLMAEILIQYLRAHNAQVFLAVATIEPQGCQLTILE
jgi:putative endonuclease